jgi:heme-degrading monooxygenase HmoA
MIVCIIEYSVSSGVEGRLEEAFASLVPEIQTIGGFISMDNFQSQTRPGVMLEVSILARRARPEFLDRQRGASRDDAAWTQ